MNIKRQKNGHSSGKRRAIWIIDMVTLLALIRKMRFGVMSL